MARRPNSEPVRIPRKDRRGASPVKVAAVLLVLSVVGLYLAFTKDIPFTQGYRVSAVFDSANSIRITTMQDPDQNDSPFIPVAVHRFGSKSTVPTDNVSRGGLFANIDLDTGVMGQAIKFPYETGGKLTWCSHHPSRFSR